MGAATVYLGMEICRDRVARTLVLTQRRYMEQLLMRHGLTDAKPRTMPFPPGARLLSAGIEEPALPDGSSSYRALVGELMFLATSTRPDIAQAVSLPAHTFYGHAQQKPHGASAGSPAVLGARAYVLAAGTPPSLWAAVMPTGPAIPVRGGR